MLSDVILDEVQVPAGNRIGAPGTGFGLVLATLATFRGVLSRVLPSVWQTLRWPRQCDMHVGVNSSA